MRKFTFLLTMLLCVATGAKAQYFSESDKLTFSSVQVSSWCNDGDNHSNAQGLSRYINDGDADTYWHSNWRSSGDTGMYGGEQHNESVPSNETALILTPEYIIIDLGETKNIAGFGYLPRLKNGSTSETNGAAKKIKIYVSTEPFAAEAEATNSEKQAVLTALSGVTPAVEQSGITWGTSPSELQMRMDAEVAGRYVLVVFEESDGIGTGQTNVFANCAEFMVYQDYLKSILENNNGYVRMISGKYSNSQSVAFYRTTSNGNEDSVGVGADENNKDGEGETTLSQIWQIIPVENVEDGYYIRHAGTGKYINKVPDYTTQDAHPLSDTPEVCYIKPSIATDKEDYFSITFKEGAATSDQVFMHHDGQMRVVVWDAAEGTAESAWKFEAAEDLQYNVTLRPSGIDNVGALATFSAPIATELPEGVKAYYAQSTGDNTVSLQWIGEGVIPANEGVILEKEGSTTQEDVVMKPIMYGSTDADFEGNLFRNTASAAYDYTESETAYILAGHDDGSGTKATFCKLISGTIAKNKAYLVLSDSEAQVIKMNFDGAATGIESVETTTNVNAPIYDLSGRRVMNAAKGGIYIQNGKKFIVR